MANLSLTPPGLVNLEKELVCSICTDLLYQPLTLLDCLHTFCGSCLKEWFSWQAARHVSSHSSPRYTCPSCRAYVRETRPNATVTTLLDMFLQANPDRAKPEDEKEEIAKKYKPGDSVLRQDVFEDSDYDSEAEETSRRLLESVRELSLRGSDGDDLANRRPSDGPGNSFRDRQARGDDPRDSAERPRRRRDDERRSRRHAQHQAARNAARAGDTLTSSGSSRQLEHQSSLRSFLSSSDLGVTSQEEIVRQIMEEGLLDDIDLENLDQAQEEELSDRLAEIWRQRHQQHVESHRRNSDHAERPRREEHRRSRSQTVQAGSTAAPSNEVAHVSAGSRSNHLEPGNVNDTPSRHQRRSSDQGARRRRTSPTPIITSSASQEPLRTTLRSSTDINEHRARVAPSGTSDTRAISSTTRRLIESDGRVPEAWTGVSRDRSPQHTSQSPQQRGMPSTPGNPSTGIVTSSPATSPSIVVSSSPRRRRDEIPDQRNTSPQSSFTGPHTNTSPLVWYVEPSITCDRCQRANIEYEIHKKCVKCNDGKYHLCLRCYRSGKGCLHWFGFGHAGRTRFELEAASEGSRASSEPAHNLRSHRYRRPGEDHHRRMNDGVTRVSDNPDERLEEGVFCDGCQALANDCFWQCSHCNEGEWGYCSRCVNQGRCCTHPLLPIRRADASNNVTATSITSTPATSESLPASIVSSDTKPYYVLSISTKCDICTYPIPPSSTRYHCPECSDGDYDVCTNCYLKSVAIGKISKENGHNGWRRCLKGHRTIVVGFEDHEEGQRRVIVRDLVGGHTIVDDYVPPSNSRNSQTGRTTAGRSGTRMASPQMGSGDWSWKDGQVRRKKASRVRAYGWNNSSATHDAHNVSALPSPVDGSAALIRPFDEFPVSPITSNVYTSIQSQFAAAAAAGGIPTSAIPPRRFPPDGGIGLILVALWSYWPEEEDHDELAFPSGAEIKEAESINEDWNWGYYAGSTGLIPAAYCQAVREVI